MTRYTMQYRTVKQRTWHSLSVSQRVPFSDEDIQRYREMLSKRHMLRGDEIEFKQIETQIS